MDASARPAGIRKVRASRPVRSRAGASLRTVPEVYGTRPRHPARCALCDIRDLETVRYAQTPSAWSAESERIAPSMSSSATTAPSCTEISRRVTPAGI